MMHQAKMGIRRPSRQYYDQKRLFGMRGWSWMQLERVGWWIREEWFDRIAGPRGLRWKEWQENGQIRVVKDGPLRTVYYVKLGETGIYIKHYRVPGLRTRLRQWVRRGKARNEGDKALRLASIGIQTIDPLALGEERKFGLLFENYLVTKEIANVEPLDYFLEKELPKWDVQSARMVRKAIGEELARLCARMHEAGFIHGDFHPGNILIRVDGDCKPSLYLIDLDALRHHKKPLQLGEIRHNLAQLNNYFWSRSSRPERLHFLENYLKYRRRHNPLAPMEMARFARDIEGATRKWAERLWRRWAKRLLGTNKYFKTYRNRSTWAVLSRKFDVGQIRPVLEDPELLIYAPDATIIKHSSSSTVAEVSIKVDGKDQRVIIKKIPTTKFREYWFGWGRGSRGWRSWKATGHLVARGIPTPEPLAFIAKGRPGMSSVHARLHPTHTYTILERPAEMVTLAWHMENRLVAMPAEERERAIRGSVRATARLMRQMHHMSLSHRDLKAANILIRPKADGTWEEMSLIDLVGVTLKHPLPERLRVKNLARLAISFHSHGLLSRTNCLRFMQAYLPLAFLPEGKWKELWREVEIEMERKIRRNSRLNRRLS